MLQHWCVVISGGSLSGQHGGKTPFKKYYNKNLVEVAAKSHTMPVNVV